MCVGKPNKLGGTFPCLLVVDPQARTAFAMTTSTQQTGGARALDYLVVIVTTVYTTTGRHTHTRSEAHE